MKTKSRDILKARDAEREKINSLYNEFEGMDIKKGREE